MSWRSRFIGFKRSYLEDDFRRQLQLACAVVASRAAVVDSRSDHTKVGAILALTRDTPYWMVEGIECVQPQLQLHRLIQWEQPEKRSVEGLVGVGTQRISRSVPKGILSRRNKGSGVNPLRRRRMRKLGIAY